MGTKRSVVSLVLHFPVSDVFRSYIGFKSSSLIKKKSKKWNSDYGGLPKIRRSELCHPLSVILDVTPVGES